MPVFDFDEANEFFVLVDCSSQILGPTAFGLTFLNTVATFPAAIFFVAMGAIVCAFTVLAFVRLPTIIDDAEEQAIVSGDSVLREETLVDTQVPLIVTGDEDGAKPPKP